LKKIGIVLSKQPSHSETFFNNKIKGLNANGYTVILFVQHADPHFTLCDQRQAPKVYSKNILLQFYACIKVFFSVLFHLKIYYHFMQLELKGQRTLKQILKNLYNNSHILNSKVDWLHFGFATIALQSEHVAKAIVAKMAVSCRGYDMDVYPLKHPKCYDLLWSQVDKVHAISHYMLERAYFTGLSTEKPYMIISPAIDVTTFKRSDFSSESTALRFLTIARLHWIKGLTETLEALSMLKQQGISFTYTIIGEGPELQSLKYAVHQLDLTSEVTFKGKVAPEHIVVILGLTDIYIQYSHSEGFCNAVLEAQAMGCLCIVSDGGALPENVIHNQTGWVVPKRDVKALVETIKYVINLSKPEKQIILDCAIARVQTSFNLKQQQEAFIRFYD
jgi:colanic acid/amylovoran biosynthesis glycosyltransferase